MVSITCINHIWKWTMYYTWIEHNLGAIIQALQTNQNVRTFFTFGQLLFSYCFSLIMCHAYLLCCINLFPHLVVIDPPFIFKLECIGSIGQMHISNGLYIVINWYIPNKLNYWNIRAKTLVLFSRTCWLCCICSGKLSLILGQ